LYLIDPATIFLFSVALCTILYGAYRSLHFPDLFKDQEEEIEKNSLKVKTAIILPIFGSILLIALFFFLNWLVYLLIILLSFSSLVGVTYAFYPLVNWTLNRFNKNKSFEFKWIGKVNLAFICTFSWALALIISWIIYPYFLLNDTLAICIAICVLSFLRIPNLKIATILLVLFFIYDIFWVFLSEFVFTKNVMLTVATEIPALPMIIVVPRALSDGWALLGNGDIVLPGIFLVFLYRFDDHQKTPFKEGYFVRAWIAYGIGLFITIIMVFALERGQPALLYLVPFTMLTTVYFARKRGQLHLLWQGIKAHEEDQPVRELTDQQNQNDATVGLLSSNDNNV